MAYRNIFIENPAKLSVRNRQLVIETDHVSRIPVEDIAVLLIENRQVSVTGAALSYLGESGTAVFICDAKHMPCSILMPFSRHSRALSVLHKQLEIKEPRKKRLWQNIIKAKISNQALCLDYNGKNVSAQKIRAYADKVRSGDKDNAEAAAALRYFSFLFGSDFRRTNEDVLNGALNYGYAILRGWIARCLAVYGFQPALGLHHRSELNQFNLADDLIEPFRPVVDLMVSSMEEFREQEFTADHRKLLFGCLSMEVLSSGQRHSVSYAADRMIQSLTHSLSEGNNELLLPELLPLTLHTYE